MALFKGTKSLYEYELSDQLGYNLKRWIEEGLVEIGGYTNITRSNSVSGYSYLKSVYDVRYGGSGYVYEGLGPSWVWESSVNIQDGSAAKPFQVSGVYINGSYCPTSNTSGLYSHTVDYENGRVLFNNAVTSGQIVQCEYTMRDVGVYLTDSPQWRTMIDTVDNYNNLATLSPSGMAQILKENRVWTPGSIFIATQDRTNKALQLGGGELAEMFVFYHIFSDKAFMSKRLADMLINQENKVLNLFNINTAPFPLSFRGSIASGALTYSQLATRGSPYFWTFGWIKKCDGGPVDDLYNVYRSECRMNVEIQRDLSTY